MTKILIFGANGWIGSQVIDILNLYGTPYKKSSYRADDIENILKEIEQEKKTKTSITHIMCFIGRTHGNYKGQYISTIDYLEKPGRLVENIQDNLFCPVRLAILSKDLGLHMTYLGTGCIFDYDTNEHFMGIEENGFDEYSKPNFFGSSYSIVKGFTDQLMHCFDDTVLNVRIRMPISDQVCDSNFITKITNYKKICSIPNSMTVLNDLLPLMVRMALTKHKGTINLTNPGLISHNDILKMYKEIVDPNFTWENFSIIEQNEILDSLRSNNYLSTHKLEFYFPGEVKSIHAAVRDILYKMKQNIINNIYNNV
jgi:3,5-epimerase/4-reductase